MNLISIFVISVLFLSAAEARGMWGSRRKTGEDEADRDSSLSSGFEENRRKAEKKDLEVSFDGASKRSQFAESSSLENIIDMYVNMMEEMLKSPDFDSIINPDVMRSLFNQIPAVASNPELLSMLDSPQFSDRQMLKQTIAEGIKMIRVYSYQLVELVNDPKQLEALLEQFPIDTRNAISGALKGDLSGLKRLVNEIPGLDRTQKKLLEKILDGDLKSFGQIMEKAVKTAIGDPKKIEDARLQLLENPKMAEMFGISPDIISDEKKWASFIDESGSQFEGFENIDQLERKFSSSTAA